MLLIGPQPHLREDLPRLLGQAAEYLLRCRAGCDCQGHGERQRGDRDGKTRDQIAAEIIDPIATTQNRNQLWNVEVPQRRAGGRV